MLTHDCSTCSGKGLCPIEAYAPWINDNKSTIEEHVFKVIKDLKPTLNATILAQPALMLQIDVLMPLIALAITTSYAKANAESTAKTPIPNYITRAFEKED